MLEGSTPDQPVVRRLGPVTRPRATVQRTFSRTLTEIINLSPPRSVSPWALEQAALRKAEREADLSQEVPCP